MIFNLISQCGNKKFFKFIINILIFTFTFTTCSCYSTYQSTVRPKSIEDDLNIQIVKAIMNSGLVVNLKDKNAAYISSYKDRGDVITYTEIIPDKSSEYNLPVSKSAFIPVKDIKALIIEKDEINPGLTVLATLGIIAGLAVLIGAIVAATKESCPFVYSFDGKKFTFDAEPYGGAIAEGLQKTDYSRLEHLKPVDGKYKLYMRNEADETQHTDEMKLLLVEHPMNTEVAPDISGNMTVIEKALAPIL
ncbi:MAG: hypothetical protein IPL53_14985 [Ignavibacteria bacterium]|nr:hypothetical protein [Ignavibacteria bacterium]